MLGAVRLMKDKRTGKRKGFGLSKSLHRKLISNALKNLNDQSFNRKNDKG